MVRDNFATILLQCVVVAVPLLVFTFDGTTLLSHKLWWKLNASYPQSIWVCTMKMMNEQTLILHVHTIAGNTMAIVVAFGFAARICTQTLQKCSTMTNIESWQTSSTTNCKCNKQDKIFLKMHGNPTTKNLQPHHALGNRMEFSHCWWWGPISSLFLVGFKIKINMQCIAIEMSTVTSHN